MRSFEIEAENVKSFMNDLLVHEKFDSFYLYEARVKTALDYYIGGKINKAFFQEKDSNDTEDSLEKNTIDSNIHEAVSEDYITWKDVKHTVFEMMKGKRLPISFKIVLMFNRENIERLVEMHNLPIDADNVSALFFNVMYETDKLLITTGTSIKIFTMDKSVDQVWDDTVEKYYVN